AWPLISGLATAALDLVLATRRREPPPRGVRARLARRFGRRAGRSPAAQAIATALTSGVRSFRSTQRADFTANIVRNVWAYAIIFCGHFPDQTYTFSQEETKDETRGQRHVRQLIGAANIEGGPLFHVASGNLGYQVEHHLF